jgi:hypothetical protein
MKNDLTYAHLFFCKRKEECHRKLTLSIYSRVKIINKKKSEKHLHNSFITFFIYILDNSRNEDTDKQRSKKRYIKSLMIGRKDEEEEKLLSMTFLKKYSSPI